MICLFHNSIHFSLLSFPRNCKRCYLDCVHPNPDIFENHTFYMNTAFSQSLLINSLEWRIRGKRARETPHIFAWTTWPEMLWPRVIMRPGDLGSLSNDDNDSVKKKLVLSAKQLLCTCITFLSTFELSLTSTARLRRATSQCDVSWRTWTLTMTDFSLFNSRKSRVHVTNWAVPNRRDGVWKDEIFSFSDIFTAVVVVVAKLPSESAHRSRTVLFPLSRTV